MKHELFTSMKEQLNPSPEAQADLKEALSRGAKAKPIPWRRYAIIAACLTLALCALPAGQAALLAASNQPRLHSYATLDQPFRPMMEQKHPIDGGGAESTTLTGGELPGGAFVGGEAAVQPGAEAYDRLIRGMGMLEENAQYPDWYGGAYIGQDGELTVLLVEDKDPGDKSLELQVLEWAGSDTVSFSSAKYSLTHLNTLMDQLNEELPPLVEEGGWSVNVAENRIDLDLVLPVDDPVLTLLARLDPDDDAIQVSAYTQPIMEYKAGPAKVQLGETPVPGGVPDADPVPGGDTPVSLPRGDLDGDTKGYSVAPAKIQSAHYDLLETPSIDTEDDPDALAVEPTDPGGISDLPGEKEAPAHYDLLPLDGNE